jgi:hypothetical protein
MTPLHLEDGTLRFNFTKIGSAMVVFTADCFIWSSDVVVTRFVSAINQEIITIA